MELIELPVKEKITMKDKRGRHPNDWKEEDMLISTSCAEVQDRWSQIILLIYPHDNPSFRLPRTYHCTAILPTLSSSRS